MTIFFHCFPFGIISTFFIISIALGFMIASFICPKDNH